MTSNFANCPYCNERFRARGLAVHKKHCKQRPNYVELVHECTNCHSTTSADGFRKGLCTACYQWRQMHDTDRPLPADMAEVDAAIAEARAKREAAEYWAEGFGLPGKPWKWTVRRWDTERHVWVEVAEIRTVMIS